MESEYEYESLQDQPHGTIRLLRLLPGKAFEQIACRLQQATVEDEFAAISYVWGTDPAADRILLDRQVFYVRQNLYQCLLHIRDEVIERHLWIDAICVDQADLRERSSQVMLMDRIFGNAVTVLAWLGTNTTDNDILLVSPSSLHEHGLLSAGAGFLRTVTYNSLLDEEPCLDPPPVEYFGDQGATAVVKCILKDLLERPYWTRMWIVQEIVVAKHLKLQYGKHQIYWGDLVNWVNTILGWSASQPQDFNTCEGAIQQSGILSTADHRRRHQEGNLRQLGKLLTQYDDRACADPRDKIISLLAITATFHGTEERLNSANLYEMSKRRLCEHVSRRYECKYEDLARRLGVLQHS